jgi:hypothetical protein
MGILGNTVNMLDQLSKSQIPNLAKGYCIVTGASFDLPVIVQFDQLEKTKRPNSDDVDLSKLWGGEELQP